MFEQLSDLFGKVSQKMGVSNELESSKICYQARQFLKQQGIPETQAQVISYDKGILKIKTMHPLISQKLKGMEEEIVKKLTIKNGLKLIN